MKTKSLFVVGLVLLLTLSFSMVMDASTLYTYNKVVEVFDWGAASPRVIINLNQKVSSSEILWNSFDVHVKSFDNRQENPFLEEGERKVREIYVSDEFGNKMEEGQHITLELEVHPNVTLGSELNYQGFNDWIEAEYTITQTKEIVTESGTIDGIIVTQVDKVFKPQIELFKLGTGTYTDPNEGEITLAYAEFSPQLDGAGKKPLIIWLHGGGEGGTDATIPLAANKAVEFAAASIQDIFGGAYVLVPQTMGRWMDPGYDDEDDGHIKVENFSGRIYPKTSKYTAALMNLIEEYVAANIGIDTSRIYIGGASNGGFMVSVMLLNYPDYFAAYFPVCGSMTPGFLFEDEVDLMGKQNIWFVVSAEDGTVPAPYYTVGLYDRIRKAGSDTAHLSYIPYVIDESGLYRDADGNPHRYDGHWSWIYAYNNDVTALVDGKEISLMDWLAQQRLP